MRVRRECITIDINNLEGFMSDFGDAAFYYIEDQVIKKLSRITDHTKLNTIMRCCCFYPRHIPGMWSLKSASLPAHGGARRSLL